jgi:negative regulator of flagellin synthesis FlgM
MATARCLPEESVVTNKISGYSNAEPIVPLKGSTGGSSVVADKAQSEASGSAPAAKAGDQLTLTNSARSLQKIEEAVANTPVVNSNKVATIKQALGNGTYKIDTSRVADKILGYERGLK